VTATQALLATAKIQVKSANGDFENLRALIDSGSQSTIISEEADQILKLPKIKNKIKISGIYSTDTCVSKLEEVKVLFSTETNLRCVSSSGICTANLNSLAPIVSEISAFIRTDRRTDEHG